MRRKFLPALFSLFIVFNSFSQSSGEGWTNLFDGKTLKGWKRLAGTANYSVENGMIVGSTVVGSGNTFLATEKEYGDFILELDIKIESPKGNSGVQTRSHFDPKGHEGKGLVYGRQVEVDPSDRKWSGGVYDEGRRQWLYPLTLHPEAQGAFKKSDFNHYHIECTGNEIRTWVNGQAVAYVVDTIDRKGFIALQVHAISDAAEANSKI